MVYIIISYLHGYSNMAEKTGDVLNRSNQNSSCTGRIPPTTSHPTLESSATKKNRGKGKKADPGTCFCKSKKGGTVIQCETCKRWCHPPCVGLSTEIIQAMEDSQPFYCPLCILKKFTTGPASVASTSSGEEDVIAKIVAEFDQLRQDVNDLKCSVQNLATKLESIHQSSSQPSPPVASEALRSQQRILESHERALRKNNAVIIGVQEDDASSTEEIVLKMFSDKLGERELPIQARRLGRKGDQRSRPILVSFPDTRSKVSIMKKRSMLKGTRVFINDDLTPLQKRNQKVLLDRMRKARHEGKSSYMIRGNLIIEGSKVASLESFDSL